MAVQPLASQVGVAPACRALGVPRASFYRRQRPAPGHQQPRPTPARALCASERAHVLDVLASPRFVDRSPAEVVATLLDEGQYLCAERTMYRILAANQPVRERRNQRSHPCYTKPELVATGPNQTWSWDITRLRGPKRWTSFYLYVLLDIFSRCVVGWMVADRENAALAATLIEETCLKQGIEPQVLTLHSDRGAPMTSKRIVHEIRKLASQTLFTSHSPYVLEEFALDETVVLGRNADGLLSQAAVALPNSIKLKAYRQNFRTRFSEGLLARRILVSEGATEAATFPVVCRRLAELKPDTYSSLEALGICMIDAGGQYSIPDMAKLYREIGKQVFAICDKQDAANTALIEAQVDMLLMHDEKGFENLVLKNTTEEALKHFAGLVDWPPHLMAKYPDVEAVAPAALSDYFGWSKANWGIADFLAQCSEAEIPKWLRDACIRLKTICMPAPAAFAEGGAVAVAGAEPVADADATD